MVKASEIQVSILDCVPVVYWYTGQVSNLQVRILRSKDQFKLPTRWQIKTRTKLKMHALHCCGAKSQITMSHTRDTITIGLESGKTFWEGVNRFLSIKTLASKFLKNTLSQQIKKKACEMVVFYSFTFFLSLMCEKGMRCIQVFFLLNSLCHRQQNPWLNRNFQRDGIEAGCLGNLLGCVWELTSHKWKLSLQHPTCPLSTN